MLRASFEPIDFGQGTVVVRRRIEPQYLFKWHFHPQYELTLIVSGRGTRFVGHHVADYHPGDLVLLGPNQPHTYVSASAAESRSHDAIVVQFSADEFGRGLLDLREMLPVRQLLERSRRGLQLTASADILQRVGTLPDHEAIDRIVSLLGILVELSRCPAATLSGEPNSSMLDSAAYERIETACRYVADHFEQGRISRGDVARAVHLTPTSFSRFFTATMGRPFTRYVNEVRVGAACSLLLTDQDVTAVATQVGYESLANFNRQFRRLQGLSPTEYRQARAAAQACDPLRWNAVAR